MPEVHLLRHGESEFNATGNRELYDAALTDLGKQQASEVKGHFDMVLCSPLRRAKETLQYSQITYNEMEIIHEARERKKDKSDLFAGEEQQSVETMQELVERALKLKDLILDYCKRYDSILVVGHWWLFKTMTSTNCDDIKNGRSRTGNGKGLNNCELFKWEVATL